MQMYSTITEVFGFKELFHSSTMEMQNENPKKCVHI